MLTLEAALNSSYIEEEQKTQWPKDKEHKDKQRVT
jgi:hypothetical protein